jgi:transposase
MATPKGPKDVTNEICDFIDHEMERNDELTSVPLTNSVNERFSLKFSAAKVKRLRKSLGWMSTKTRYCQLVREVNREKRLQFALECLRSGDTFDDVIWTDECNVQLDWNGTLTFHRWWEPCPEKGKPKHPTKVSVWAGISKYGATPILTFEGIMEKTFYCDSILVDTLVPFLRSTFTSSHRFMQDNDPKHTSILGRETMANNDINWWKTPPESPDMNPIENMWHQLKHHLRTIVKPRTKDALLTGIMEFWVTITPEKCRRYIDHLKRVLPVVVERNGKPSGF